MVIKIGCDEPKSDNTKGRGELYFTLHFRLFYSESDIGQSKPRDKTRDSRKSVALNTFML